MRAFRVFFRNISSALKSITRNFSLSIASISCTSITLIIVAIAMIVSGNINSFTKDFADTMTILVFVDKDATAEEVDVVKSKILEIKNIKSDEIIYKDKEKIKEDTMAMSDPNSPLYSIMESWDEESNPLESEFILAVNNIEKIEETSNSLKSIEHVSNVQYSEDVISKMIPTFNIIEKITIVIIVGLILVSVFLICNTIKLTIFARRDEIDIMRLVGTSNFVIKLPFVFEGLFLGIIGSIIPVAVTIWGYIFAFDKLDKHLFANFLKMIDPMPFTLMISLCLVGIGALVGMIGSAAIVRKYLKI